MNSFWKQCLAALILGVVLAGCTTVTASPTSPDTTGPVSSSVPPLATPSQDSGLGTEPAHRPDPVGPTLPAGEGGTAPQDVVPQALLQQALEDLSARLGASQDEIEVTVTEAVIWDNGSLGCPQPGNVYTEAQVDGYRIVLRYQAQTYEYHTNDQRAFLCEQALAAPRTQPEMSTELKLVQAAMADMAQRLGISTAEIVPEPILPRTWPDTSLGCPQPEQVYLPVETRGYEIILKAGDEAFTYHTDLERVVYCDAP